MPAWTGVDLVAASAFAMALFGVLLLGALISRAREDVLASPVGWRLLAAALTLFAARGLLHVAPIADAWLLHAAGILAAAILPVGLVLVLRGPRRSEVDPDAR
jgi:hypothetical protein